MNGLGSVYFYIDVMKNEIKGKESLSIATLRQGGELVQMRKALSRFEQIATALEGDRAEQMTQECIAKIVRDVKKNEGHIAVFRKDVKGEKHGIHNNSSIESSGTD